MAITLFVLYPIFAAFLTNIPTSLIYSFLWTRYSLCCKNCYYVSIHLVSTQPLPILHCIQIERGNTIAVATIIITCPIDTTYISIFLCWYSLEKKYIDIVTYLVTEPTIIYVLKDKKLQPLESFIHPSQ